MEQTKKRAGYIDVAKGLGMLAVIWGHLMYVTVEPTHKFVYGFHIPLFFFMAGMVFNPAKYTFGNFVKRRARTLLLPYVIFSVLSWALWAVCKAVLSGGADAQTLLFPLWQTVIAQGSKGFLIHNAALWYVTCLFVTELISYFLCKLKPVWNIVLSVGFAVLGWAMLTVDVGFDFTLLPWNIEVACSAVLFYTSGNLFTKYATLNGIPETVGKKPWLWGIVCAVLTAVLIVGSQLNGHVSMGSDSLGNSTLAFYAIGFCGVASTLIFSALLAKIDEKSKLVKGIEWIGRNSFYCMALHLPVKEVVMVFANRIGVTNEMAGSTMLHCGWTFVLTLIGTIIAVVVANKVVAFVKKTHKQSQNA